LQLGLGLIKYAFILIDPPSVIVPDDKTVLPVKGIAQFPPNTGGSQVPTSPIPFTPNPDSIPRNPPVIGTLTTPAHPDVYGVLEKPTSPGSPNSLFTPFPPGTQKAKFYPDSNPDVPVPGVFVPGKTFGDPSQFRPLNPVELPNQPTPGRLVPTGSNGQAGVMTPPTSPNNPLSTFNPYPPGSYPGWLYCF
jgi:hypothetical protein